MHGGVSFSFVNGRMFLMFVNNFIGREQQFDPKLSKAESYYVQFFGIPIIGLRIRARNIFSLIPRGSYRRILDAGSGPGVFSFELSRRFPDAEIVAVDIDDDALESCRKIQHHLDVSNIKFQQCSIESLGYQDEFDLAISVDMLEHIEDDIHALRNFFKSLRAGGVLVMHVPARFRRYPVFKKSLNFDVVGHFRVGYEIDELKEKLALVGFKIESCGFTYGFWETLSNNLSFMITGARRKNKILYALLFPPLYLLSFLGARARPKNLGSGVFAVAVKE
jgi:SAM-dependent methyltransferase